MDTFGSHPFWSTAFVGLGPYRLTRWEPGSFIEGEAFPGFVLGTAKIDRVRLTFAGDPNAALTRLFADDVDLLADSVAKSQQLPAIEQDWIGPGRGSVVTQPNSYRAAHFQFRPELVAPSALLDLRVRRALAYAIDKQAVNEGIYRGTGILATSPFPPGSYAGEPDRAAVQYPTDVRRAEQLMAEAGYTRGTGRHLHPPHAGSLRR
jgi:ABC-type transport system substrate-binding protein